MAKKVSKAEEIKTEEAKVEETVAEEVEETKNVAEKLEGSKKKKSSALKYSIIAVIVLLLGVGCFFGYKLLMGNNPVKVTSNAIRGLKDNIADFSEDGNELAKFLNSDSAFEIEGNVSVDLPDVLKNSYAAKYLMQLDQKGETIKLDLSLKEGKSEVIDLSALVEQAKLYFKFNDTMRNFYFMDIDKASSSVEIPTNIKLPDYKFEKLVDYLADAFDKSFSKSDFEKSKDELTIKDKDIKVNKYTATVDEKKLKSIIDEFIIKVEKDDDFMEALATMSNSSEKEIKAAFDEVLATKPSDLGEIEFDYSVYVTSLGKAVGYGIGLEGTDIIIAEDDDVVSVQVIVSGMPIYIDFEEKSDDHIVATLNAMGMITGSLDVKSDMDKVSKNEYKEEVSASFKLSGAGLDYEGSLVIDSNIKKIDKVDTSAKAKAKDINKLSDSELSELENEIYNSKFFSFISSLTNNKISY